MSLRAHERKLYRAFSASYLQAMTGLPKVRVLWIFGVMLVCIGALFHSHAESWAFYDVSATQAAVNYPLKNLFEDTGIAMMAMGGIAFTLGIIGWLYPPRVERGI